MASLVIWGLVLLFDSELKKLKKKPLAFSQKTIYNHIQSQILRI